MRWLLLLSLLLGCPSAETPDCTAIAIASVQVTVEDEAGGAITDATLSWTSDEGTPTTCENNGGGEFVCGWEVGGEMTIEVSADGFEDQTVGVTVASDECHVITEMITVTLIAEAAPG